MMAFTVLLFISCFYFCIANWRLRQFAKKNISVQNVRSVTVQHY